MGDSESGIEVGIGAGSKFYQFGAGVGIRMPVWNRNQSRSRDRPERPIFAVHVYSSKRKTIGDWRIGSSDTTGAGVCVWRAKIFRNGLWGAKFF